MRIFNTDGPVNRADVYKIDPLTRLDLDRITRHLEYHDYFQILAPKGSGKTSYLYSLEEYLNKQGNYYAVYSSFRGCDSSEEDFKKVAFVISQNILCNVKRVVGDNFNEDEALANYGRTESLLGIDRTLSYLSRTLDKPFILFLDDTDVLSELQLYIVLRNIRPSFIYRPGGFPSSIVFSGIRNVKKATIRDEQGVPLWNAVPFNVLADTYKLPNFTRDDVIELFSQHTKETGQKFAEGCFDIVMEYTEGQPLLVNTLAKHVTETMVENTDRSFIITAEMFKKAQERLIR